MDSEVPPTNEDQLGAAAFAAPPPHFTHITVNGCNLMGLLNIFGCIGILVLVIVLPVSGIPGLILIIFAAFLSFASDLFFRIRSRRRKLWIQLLSPHAGGSLFFIPVWATYPAMAITILVMLLFKR
jgi:hypothetical protein